eukprot:9281023-Pyramimonas_sp.AAC.1
MFTNVGSKSWVLARSMCDLFGSICVSCNWSNGAVCAMQSTSCNACGAKQVVQQQMVNTRGAVYEV